MKDKKADVAIEQTEAEVGQDSARDADNEAIAKRAYELWHQRGCPNDSPHEDWLRAEQELRGSNAAEAQHE